MQDHHHTPDKDAIALLPEFERLGLDRITLVNTAAQAHQAFVAGAAMDDQLANEGIVVRRDHIALIGGCRSGEAITKHPISGLQRRQQERFDMLGTVGCIKKQFGSGQGLHPLGRMQQ